MASNRAALVWNIATAVCAVLFMLGSTILWSTGTYQMYVSPDETANAWFIDLFASTGSMRFVDPLNKTLDDAVHPRSMIVWNGITRPIGFLGLPTLYGAVAALAGAWIVPLLTPLIATMAVFAWRSVLTRWFDARMANIAAMLLFTLPTFWYYTARALMPNVLFVSLLLFSLFFWVRRPIHARVSAVGSGLTLGLALFVRASEAPWIIVMIVGLMALFWKRVKWSDVGLFFVGAVIGIAPFFLMNVRTYDHPLITGYTLPSIEQNVNQDTTATTESLLLPFGIDPRETWRNVFDYGLALFWWWSIPAALGFVMAYKQQSRVTISLLILFVLLAIWLGFYYGSWTIHDNPDATQVTIANSYTRYWLPVFVLMTPLIALSLTWTAHRTRRFMLPVLLSMLVVANIYATFFTGQDGLLQVRRTLVRSAEIRMQVLAHVESESLIIVDRADKLFFPHRVTYPLREQRTYQRMPRAVEQVPLYYYGITFPERDLEYLNTKKLKELGLQIEFLRSFDEESLYRISTP